MKTTPNETGSNLLYSRGSSIVGFSYKNEMNSIYFDANLYFFFGPLREFRRLKFTVSVE